MDGKALLNLKPNLKLGRKGINLFTIKATNIGSQKMPTTA